LSTLDFSFLLGFAAPIWLVLRSGAKAAGLIGARSTVPVCSAHVPGVLPLPLGPRRSFSSDPRQSAHSDFLLPPVWSFSLTCLRAADLCPLRAARSCPQENHFRFHSLTPRQDIEWHAGILVFTRYLAAQPAPRQERPEVALRSCVFGLWQSSQHRRAQGFRSPFDFCSRFFGFCVAVGDRTYIPVLFSRHRIKVLSFLIFIVQL
jgi:hypothetical protein